MKTIPVPETLIWGLKNLLQFYQDQSSGVDVTVQYQIPFGEEKGQHSANAQLALVQLNGYVLQLNPTVSPAQFDKAVPYVAVAKDRRLQ